MVPGRRPDSRSKIAGGYLRYLEENGARAAGTCEQLGKYRPCILGLLNICLETAKYRALFHFTEYIINIIFG